MRFLKVVKRIKFHNRWDADLEVGDVILKSRYFKQIVVCSDGVKKTRFIYSWRMDLYDLLIDGFLTPLTSEEFEKIKPHLKKETKVDYD